MEVRALRFRLIMKAFFLLAAQDEVCRSTEANVVFPEVTPNRLQFFEYEPIIVDCEGLMGLTGWRVLKKIRGETKPCAGTWELSISPCKVKNAIPSIDNGEYWCEMGVKKKSSSINITVTAGSVILEGPVRPVKEGGDVTLICRNRKFNSNSTAQFFKGGVLMGSSITGKMTIYGVSSFHEGFYKCSVPGVGESPMSWLTVREAGMGDPPSPPPPPPPPPLEPQASLLLQICISFGIFLMVLLLLVGLLQCKQRQRVATADIPDHSPSVTSLTPVQTVFVEARTDVTAQTTHSFNKPKKKKGSGVSRSFTGPVPSAGY